MRPGRTFIRHLLAAAKAPDHHIYIHAAARSDLAWWGLFVDAWNGLSMLYTHQLSSPQHVVVSDATGSWGCGAYSGQQWFQLCWSGSDVREETIMVKELIPIVIATASFLGGHTVQCKCDNQAVVAVISSRTSKLPMIMHLLRCLFFFEAHFKGARSECFRILT